MLTVEDWMLNLKVRVQISQEENCLLAGQEDWMLNLKVRVQIFQEENCLLSGALVKYGPSAMLARIV